MHSTYCYSIFISHSLSQILSYLLSCDDVPILLMLMAPLDGILLQNTSNYCEETTALSNVTFCCGPECGWA